MRAFILEYGDEKKLLFNLIYKKLWTSRKYIIVYATSQDQGSDENSW